jgi:hypothetical protein
MKYNHSRVKYKVNVQQYLLGAWVYDLNSLYVHYKELVDQRKARGAILFSRGAQVNHFSQVER